MQPSLDYSVKTQYQRPRDSVDSTSVCSSFIFNSEDGDTFSVGKNGYGTFPSEHLSPDGKTINTVSIEGTNRVQIGTSFHIPPTANVTLNTFDPKSGKKNCFQIVSFWVKIILLCILYLFKETQHLLNVVNFGW
jgi:hypothetical protein